MTDAQYVDLLRAIRKHADLSLDDIRQAGEYGADSGWAGFTYTTDGAAFYHANRETIWELAVNDADEMGAPNVLAFVGTFNRADMADTPGGFACLLAWYALESVGRHLTDRRENRA